MNRFFKRPATHTRNAIFSSMAFAVLSYPVAAEDGFSTQGFSISLGGEVIAGATPPYRRGAEPIDRQLRSANVDVKFEGLNHQRLLNVSTDDLRASYVGGETVTFRTSTNYPAYLDRAEVVIYDRSRPGRSIVSRLPAQPNGKVNWVMPQDGSPDLAYAVRVYDAKGRYDETLALPLRRTATAFETNADPFTAAGEGESRLARRTIPLHGGLITVAGTNAVPGSTVSIMGEAVPVDSAGRFVVSRVLPAGDQVVEVNVNGNTLRRDVKIPRSDWFYVGIIDITAGYRDGGIDDENETYTDGRAAYYVNGRTESGWHIVSSLDTQEGPIEDIFRRLNDKDPRRVLDRLREDGTDLYPTYGDDSQWYDDTPTSGNVYVRVQNETTRFTWGNFKSGINGTTLLNSSRDLYGAELRYSTAGVTARGEPRIAATVYAAQPDTRAQRDILRGTGGSVYFLSRQDITGGSTTLSVQVVDPDTGFIVSSRTLVEGADYRVDHLQGVVVLTGPLSSGTSDGGLIDGAGSDYDINLIAQYEFTPIDASFDDVAFGGRVEAWVSDDFRLGVTHMNEETGAGKQTMTGIDLRYQLGENSGIDVEFARTDGPGFLRSLSTDGGLTITSTGGAVADNAGAIRVVGSFDMADLGYARPGTLAFHYEKKDAGFSTLTEDITEDQQLYGLSGAIELSDRMGFAAKAEHFSRDGGEEKTEGEVSLSYKINDKLTVAGALGFLDQIKNGRPDETGERVDAGLRLTYKVSDNATVYSFAQTTIDKSGTIRDNDRIGLGTSVQVSDKLKLAGEVSGGDGGTAGNLLLSYRPTADNEVYLGYTLDPTRADGRDLDDNGRFVIGGSYRYNEHLTTFTEAVLDMPGDQQSLTRAYGVTYTPAPSWALTAGLENGKVTDDIGGDFDRAAYSFGAAYNPNEDLSTRVRLEYRSEDGMGLSRDRETWGLSAGYSNKINKDWRILANVEALYSDSAESDFRDGEYVRASLGYAYRPIENERLNILFRFTHYRDLPGEDQVNGNGEDDGPLQISNVLSIAASYDLTQKLTLGAKLGYRKSEIADRGADLFVDNTATLAALRLDYHLVHQWDIMAEGRILKTKETGTTETGSVLGVYRHIGKNAKIGLGYEWGSVSDDATDIDYEAQGLFLNFVAKF